MGGAVELALAGERLHLLAERAVLLPEHSTLLVADAHVGKAVLFRRLGVPVPQGTTAAMLLMLTRLIDATRAEHLVFLGDFLHSSAAHAESTQKALAEWRRRHATLALTLVRGNHDMHAGDPAPSLRIAAHDEPLHLGGLALCHHPRSVAGYYALAGHLHPCVSAAARARDRLRLPCFWFAQSPSRQVGVLPAFGAFTGMQEIARQPGDRVFAVATDRVLELP